MPSSTALLFLGASDKNWGPIKLPLDLSPFGAKGCAILAGGDALFATPIDKKGDATLQISIPLDVKLCGLNFYNQYLVLDPKANGLGWVATNAGKATLGR